MTYKMYITVYPGFFFFNFRSSIFTFSSFENSMGVHNPNTPALPVDPPMHLDCMWMFYLVSSTKNIEDDQKRQ